MTSNSRCNTAASIRIVVPFLCFFILLFLGCDKDKNKTPLYTLKGYIYKDCSMQPLANEPLELSQDIITDFLGHSTGGLLVTSTTDAAGYFVFSYKPQNPSPLLIRMASGDPIIGIPVDTNLEDIVAYQLPTCNIQVNLNVINPYTINDTLYIKNFAQPNQLLSIPGPFTSGVIYTAIDFFLLGVGYPSTQQYITWNINKNEPHFDYFQVYTYCSDTTFVTVDIY